MPRKLLLIVFCFCLTCAHAQVGYKKCTVYSIRPGNSNDSFVSKVQLYNKFGKITEERTYKQVNDSIVNTAMLSNVTFYTYIKDTSPSLKKTICFGNHDRCLDDTTIAIYSYNDNNKIVNIISASYGRGGSGCLVGALGTRWYDSTKTNYHYDENGNLTHVATSDISDNFPTGFTTGFSSNFTAYQYDNKKRISSIRHLHVYSLDDFGREFIKEHGYADTTELAIQTFSYRDQAYAVDLVERDDYRIVQNTSYFFQDHSKNVVQEYLHDRYLNKWEDNPVERFYSYKPDKRLTKEIQYDEHGQIIRVNNYYYE